MIDKGAVYIRRYRPRRDLQCPRAETARAETAQDWAALIRRCTRFDREALLSQIEALIAQQPAPADLRQVLLAWHTAARQAFLALATPSPHAARISLSHHAFSYLIAPQTHVLEPAQLPEFLRRCAFDAQTRFGRGPRLFEPPYRAGARPRFVADPACGDPDSDFLETAWLRAHPAPDNADFWRVSPRGLAALVRDYAEDRPDAAAPERCEIWLSPVALARDLAELLFHARALSRFFPAPARVLVRCDWWGLAGRRLADRLPPRRPRRLPSAIIAPPGWISTSPGSRIIGPRRSPGSWPRWFAPSTRNSCSMPSGYARSYSNRRSRNRRSILCCASADPSWNVPNQRSSGITPSA